MIYTVSSGETLAGISIKFLGSAAPAATLFQINRKAIKSGSPSRLAAGEKLIIPDQMISAAKSKRKATPGSSEVALEVNGIEYVGWQMVRITRSMETASAAFDVDVFDRWDVGEDPWPIFDFDEVKVWIGTDLLIEGYVDHIRLSVDGSSHSMGVSGRDRTADLVDCSAMNRPGTFKNKKLEDLAQLLAQPFGVKVVTDQDTGAPIPSFTLSCGEKVHEAISRMAIAKNLIVTSAFSGKLAITRSGEKRSHDAIVEGKNLLAGSADVSSADRFSDYIVEGQTSGQGAATKSIRGSYKDAGVTRYRPLQLHAESKASKPQLANRAQWEARARAAKARSANITLQGWRQSNGALWQTNRIVPVTSPTLGLDGDMLIGEVSFELSESGMLTNLRLVRPDAYTSEAELRADKEIIKAQRKGRKGGRGKIKATAAEIEAEKESLKEYEDGDY